MDKLKHAWDVFQVIAPYLVTVFIPSVITGLSLFPQTKGAVKYVQMVLDFFSVLSHHDSPGTFKLPATRSAPPPIESAAAEAEVGK